jgi:hypothetical protein
MMRLAGRTVSALAAALVFLTGAGLAQDRLPPREPSPLTVRQIHSGHSLSDAYGSNPWPGRLTLATAIRAGDRAYDTVQMSSVPGSPMHWRWNNPSYPPDAKQDIGRFELLVITEGVPLQPVEEYFKADTLDTLDRWAAHAWQNGNGGKGAELMIYSTWTFWQHSEGPPDYDREADVPFRERLDRDGARWERMQDTANANRPAGMPPVYMIPGHRLMMRIHDDIAAGNAPGLTSIGDIFADDIHLNAKGQYAITCLVYAVIYQRNPRELPDRLAEPDAAMSAATARYFKTIAWEVATGYPRSGVPGP